MSVEIYPECNDIVAHLPGIRRALKGHADRIAALAAGTLSQHRHEGHAKITVTAGTKLDYFVNLEDRDSSRGAPAAAAIEFGHMAPNGRWVEGVHALTRSFR